MAQFIAPLKSPGAVLDYGIDWTEVLEVGEVVDSVTWLVAGGVTLDRDSLSGSIAVAWVSGGTSGGQGVLTCAAMTSAGRTYERSILVPIMQR